MKVYYCPIVHVSEGQRSGSCCDNQILLPIRHSLDSYDLDGRDLDLGRSLCELNKRQERSTKTCDSEGKICGF